MRDSYEPRDLSQISKSKAFFQQYNQKLIRHCFAWISLIKVVNELVLTGRLSH